MPKLRPVFQKVQSAMIKLRKLAFPVLVGLVIIPAAHGQTWVQPACCGPDSMYNEQNSTPLQFQEDNATGQACCGLGSQNEIEQERQRELMQNWQRRQNQDEDNQ
jgi:hypothetical protein